MKKLVYLFLFVAISSFAQNFDNGRMWTFDNPPIDYFEKTYGFKPDQEWLDHVQKSALRFSSYCSASFVSEDGLVMTNHHCARESGTSVSKPGEDIGTNGFWAKKLSDERKVPGLFVDQLVKIKDITAIVNNALLSNSSVEEQIKQRDAVLQNLTSQYKDSTDWKGLELQIVTFYKGGKFALYGYKRYKDVRLVFMPELQLGFYGGDPDNFTYPRYALDMSFFRVYDETGKPLKTKYFYKFNLNGAAENEAVFVIGNPGRTDRLSTSEQLSFYKNIQLPIVLTWLRNRSEVLLKEYQATNNEEIRNKVFSLDNATKAYTGMLAGLLDSNVINRKLNFELGLKSNVNQKSELSKYKGTWDSIATFQKEINSIYAELFVLGDRKYSSQILNNARYAAGLYDALKTNDSLNIKKYKEALTNFNPQSQILEKGYIEKHIEEVKQYLAKSEYSKQLEVLSVEQIFNSQFGQKEFVNQLSKYSIEEFEKINDKVWAIGKQLYDNSSKVTKIYSTNDSKMGIYNSKLAMLQFEVYGNSIPPDATFTLRIADGIVKGYKYNGTIAPYKTTFYGMYDRYYSNDKKFPWSLPTKWENPPAELLPMSCNFVSTNDIIGGNSGSPMINKNKEVVGLIFDGNIESLPGRFIFLEEYNRTVSVHSAGMYGAIKYIYKAKRLATELEKGKLK